jgi:hypothetical protein
MAGDLICPYLGKITYPNPQRAWTAAIRFNRRKKQMLKNGVRRWATVHRCTNGCWMWHLTTQTREEREAK